MDWAEFALAVKEHGNAKIRKEFKRILEERNRQAKEWARKTKSEEMAFILESLSAGYEKALRVLK